MLAEASRPLSNLLKSVARKLNLNDIGYHKLDLLTALRHAERLPLPWQQIAMLACNARIDQVKGKVCPWRQLVMSEG